MTAWITPGSAKSNKGMTTKLGSEKQLSNASGFGGNANSYVCIFI